VPFPDLTDFWVPAARLILDGRPQDIYSVRLAIYGQEFPNAYPPLLFLLLAPFVALADALGLSYGGTDPATGAVMDGFGASVAGVPLLCADVALAWLLCTAARERLDRRDRLWLYALLLVQALPWFSSVKVQHHESMLLGALIGSVLCLERGRNGWSVALASLALCLKATALLALPALALALYFRGQRRAALAMALVPAAALAAMLAPWLWFRWEQTTYSLLRFETLRPVFGVSAAKLAAGTALEPAVVRLSNAALLALAALGSAVLLRRGSGLRQALALAYLLGLLLSRWVYPHYLLVPCGLLLLWEMRRPSFPRLSLLAASWLWAVQSPYFPEITLESSLAVRLRAGIWAASLLALLSVVARGPEQQDLPGRPAVQP
jgi:hypothetical protein